MDGALKKESQIEVEKLLKRKGKGNRRGKEKRNEKRGMEIKYE